MQLHLLSFKGLDPYARAGGLASRITGLANSLAEVGYETHLWFVGDPQLPGHETIGRLQLHRWCQWISQYHPNGVYDGEESKRMDYVASLPPFLCQEVLLPHLRQAKRTVVLAEEWHTVDAVLHLDWLLRNAGVCHQVTILSGMSIAPLWDADARGVAHSWSHTRRDVVSWRVHKISGRRCTSDARQGALSTQPSIWGWPRVGFSLSGG
jgi:hypothetical protein